MTIKQISVFVQNTPGRLSAITKLLAQHKINIRAISISDTIDFGILRMIVDQPEKCEQMLSENGITASITNVLAVGIADTPGSLAEILSLLDEKNINVEYVYAYISNTSKQACIIMRVVDTEAAEKAFAENNVKVLAPKEIYNSDLLSD